MKNKKWTASSIPLGAIHGTFKMRMHIKSLRVMRLLIFLHFGALNGHESGWPLDTLSRALLFDYTVRRNGGSINSLTA